MGTVELLRSLPKSLYVSWRLTDCAWKLPILVRYNTCLKSLKGKVNLVGGGGEKAMIKFGFSSVGIFDNRYQRPIIEIAGTMNVEGKASFGGCARLCVMKGGELTIGKHFNNSAKLTIVCGKEIKIGNDFLASWDTLIMDTDFHPLENTETGEVGEKCKPISIGNNVWLGMRSIILKGSNVPNNCVVAAQSVVNKAFCEPNCVLAGNPAVVKKRNIRRY